MNTIYGGLAIVAQQMVGRDVIKVFDSGFAQACIRGFERRIVPDVAFMLELNKLCVGIDFLGPADDEVYYTPSPRSVQKLTLQRKAVMIYHRACRTFPLAPSKRWPHGS